MLVEHGNGCVCAPCTERDFPPQIEVVTGKKHDAGKERWSLLPTRALRAVVRVLMHGAEKYGVGNWRLVPDHEPRYLDATLRHITARMEGEVLDPESGAPHLAHAVCCLLFLLSREGE